MIPFNVDRHTNSGFALGGAYLDDRKGSVDKDDENDCEKMNGKANANDKDGHNDKDTANANVILESVLRSEDGELALAQRQVAEKEYEVLIALGREVEAREEAETRGEEVKRLKEELREMKTRLDIKDVADGRPTSDAPRATATTPAPGPFPPLPPALHPPQLSSSSSNTPNSLSRSLQKQLLSLRIQYDHLLHSYELLQSSVAEDRARWRRMKNVLEGKIERKKRVVKLVRERKKIIGEKSKQIEMGTETGGESGVNPSIVDAGRISGSSSSRKLKLETKNHEDVLMGEGDVDVDDDATLPEESMSDLLDAGSKVVQSDLSRKQAGQILLVPESPSPPRRRVLGQSSQLNTPTKPGPALRRSVGSERTVTSEERGSKRKSDKMEMEMLLIDEQKRKSIVSSSRADDGFTPGVKLELAEGSSSRNKNPDTPLNPFLKTRLHVISRTEPRPQSLRDPSCPTPASTSKVTWLGGRSDYSAPPSKIKSSRPVLVDRDSFEDDTRMIGGGSSRNRGGGPGVDSPLYVKRVRKSEGDAGGLKSKRQSGSRMSEGSQPVERYEINPDRNNGITHAYHETVRKKEERKKLDGGCCEECQAYYEMTKDIPAASDGIAFKQNYCIHNDHTDYARDRHEEMQQHKNQVSRHKEVFAKPPTPPGFWESGFPSTAKVAMINRKAKEMDEKKRDMKRLEASKPDGRYRRREQ